MSRNPLAAYRDAVGLSQAALARVLGVEQSMVSDWENDRRHPSRDNALAVERKTGGAVPASAWTKRHLVARVPRRKAS